MTFVVGAIVGFGVWFFLGSKALRAWIIACVCGVFLFPIFGASGPVAAMAGFITWYILGTNALKAWIVACGCAVFIGMLHDVAWKTLMVDLRRVIGNILY